MAIEPVELQKYGGRHYHIGELLLPSVTMVLAATRPSADSEALQQWAAQVGEEQAEHIRSSAAERGTRLHALIERRLSGQLVEQIEAQEVGVLPWWSSVLPVLSRLQTVHLLEHTVHHPHYCYAGSLDLVATIGNDSGQPGENGERLVLIDWKTSSKTKQRAWLGDYPLQLAAYWQALQATHPGSCSEAWVVLAHPYGPAQIHRFYRGDLERNLRLWLKRLQQFWLRYPDHPLSSRGLQALQKS